MSTAQPVSEDPVLLLIAEFCKLHGRVVSQRKLSLTDQASPEIRDRIDNLLMSQRFEVSSDKLDLTALQSERGPWFVRTGENEWHLLLEVGAKEAILRDALGTDRLIPNSELAALGRTDIIIARPRFRTQARVGDFAKEQSGHWFWRPLLKQWRVFRDVGVAAVIANCLATAVALFAMQVYDRVVPTGAMDTLWVLAVGAAMAILFEWVIRAARVTLLESAGRRLDQQIGKTLFARAINIRMAHMSPSPGTLVTQLREFESVREFFTSASTALLSDLPFVCFFIAAIAFIGGSLAIVPAVAMVLLILPALILQPYMSKLAGENLRESAHKNGLLWESFSGIENVKSSGAERWLEGVWSDLHEQLSDTSAKVRGLSQWIALWTMAIQQFAYVGVIVTGVYLIHAGNLSVGGLVACSILVSRVIAPLSQASGLLARWQHVKSALHSLDDLMEAPVERPADRQFLENPDLTGELSMEGVSWRPEPTQSAIVRIDSVSIKAGESVALLGASGSGKSTLLKLLSGLVTPSEGQIRVDSLNLEHLDPVDRADQIAYLPQTVAIFQGTLRHNLNPGQKPVSDETLLKLSDSIGLGPFIQSRALGLDTPLIGQGDISGGQRQLIGIARILLGDPKIVLLDEPTAALDQETEKKVISALMRWGQHRTLLVSTHKRALLSLVGRLLVLKDGQLVMDSPAQQAAGRESLKSAGGAS